MYIGSQLQQVKLHYTTSIRLLRENNLLSSLSSHLLQCLKVQLQ